MKMASLYNFPQEMPHFFLSYTTRDSYKDVVVLFMKM